MSFAVRALILPNSGTKADAIPPATGGPMRLAAIQMSSSDDLKANLDAAEALVTTAARTGARFIALPENFAYMRREGLHFPCAQECDGPILNRVKQWARSLDCWILAGTFPERIPGEERVFNSSALVSAQGEIVAVYRKIHLFDVELGGNAGSYRESASVAPGQEIVVHESPLFSIGLSVCYDLRFPELYRSMAARGAKIITVPSAFTPSTGRDHWEVLLRARAIENQVYIVAPAQWGTHNEKRSSYGRSLIVDPWGTVIAQAADRPGLVLAEYREEDLQTIRQAMPVFAHRRVTVGNSVEPQDSI